MPRACGVAFLELVVLANINDRGTGSLPFKRLLDRDLADPGLGVIYDLEELA